MRVQVGRYLYQESLSFISTLLLPAADNSIAMRGAPISQKLQVVHDAVGALLGDTLSC